MKDSCDRSFHANIQNSFQYYLAASLIHRTSRKWFQIIIVESLCNCCKSVKANTWKRFNIRIRLASWVSRQNKWKCIEDIIIETECVSKGNRQLIYQDPSHKQKVEVFGGFYRLPDASTQRDCIHVDSSLVKQHSPASHIDLHLWIQKRGSTPSLTNMFAYMMLMHKILQFIYFHLWFLLVFGTVQYSARIPEGSSYQIPSLWSHHSSCNSAPSWCFLALAREPLDLPLDVQL